MSAAAVLLVTGVNSSDHEVCDIFNFFCNYVNLADCGRFIHTFEKVQKKMLVATCVSHDLKVASDKKMHECSSK